jgi:NAD(P)-dependent dehydrogenase (short-subunit alcohol dehydrogenase family)
MGLQNRVALVTGGSRGIGRGIAVKLAQDGARIAIAYRSNKTAAQQTLRLLQSSGTDCVAVEIDINDPARAEQLVRTVVDRFGRLDILVNNVGDFRWGTLAESPIEDWQNIISSNLMTVLYASRAALPHMRRGGCGTRVWSGKDFCLCGGEGCGGGVVAIAGAGRGEERNYGECGESVEHR